MNFDKQAALSLKLDWPIRSDIHLTAFEATFGTYTAINFLRAIAFYLTHIPLECEFTFSFSMAFGGRRLCKPIKTAHHWYQKNLRTIGQQVSAFTWWKYARDKQSDSHEDWN